MAKQTEKIYVIEADKAMPLLDKMLDETAERIAYARARWQDEREYEDWSEYQDYMRKICEEFPEAKFTGASKRPFGFTFVLRLDNGKKTLDHKFRIAATSTYVNWKMLGLA